VVGGRGLMLIAEFKLFMIVEIDDLYIGRLLASCGAIFVWLSISSGVYSARILDGSMVWVDGCVCEAVSVLSVMVGFDMVSRLNFFHCFEIAGWFIWQQKGFTQISHFISKPVLWESWSLSWDAFIYQDSVSYLFEDGPCLSFLD
jgi:hypothetical protein